MVEIGGKPILWHIMNIYAAHGFKEFVVACGYKASVIKEYFMTFRSLNADFTVDLANDSIEVHSGHAEPWKVTLIDTGPDTYTGGRLKRVADHIDDTFCFTYGDGVSDVDIRGSIDFHRRHGKLCTMTAVQPPGRFGYFELGEDHEQRAAGHGEKGSGATTAGEPPRSTI